MAFLRYTLLRVLLFLAVAALLWIVGLRGLWLVMFAILGSGIVSIFALSKSRDAASIWLSNRLAKVKRRMDHRTAAEDAWDEQQRAGPARAGWSTSSDAAPGRDLPDREDADEVTRPRDDS
jgi:hypothetical protein